jgi:uncharacterized membrane protein HdeD (DUF308 family)
MQWIAKTWWILVARGVVSLLLAMVALGWPGGASAAITVLFGAFALVDGTAAIGMVSMSRAPREMAYGVRAIAGVLAGIAAVMTPMVSAGSLAILAGMWALAAGAGELTFSVRARAKIGGVDALVGGAVLTLVFSAPMIVFPPPGTSGVLVAVVALFAINGSAAVAAGMKMHTADTTPRYA